MVSTKQNLLWKDYTYFTSKFTERSIFVLSKEVIVYGNIINENYGTGFGGLVISRRGCMQTIRASQSMKDVFVIDKRNDKDKSEHK
jgi:hypothetical protein